jgi:hypothetical protein
MSPYLLAVVSLALAVVIQCIATGIMTQAALQRPYRRAAMVLAIGLGLLALHHAFTLELALHSGLFDLRQALLAAGVSLLLLLGLAGLRR